MQRCIDADDFVHNGGSVDVAWCERAHVTVLRLILALLLATHSLPPQVSTHNTLHFVPRLTISSVSRVSTAAPHLSAPSTPRTLEGPPPPGQQL